MQPEEQILGYFIEEAKEQLNTIEQGLLNLEITLKNAEMMNEIFRAAHSLKGSASMLGLSSIQHISHCLEDWFKILQEHPVKVDLNLESLLLDICDRLKILIDNLSFPIDLSEQESEIVISKWLDEHRKKLQSLIPIYDHDHLDVESSELNSFAGLFATDISTLDDNWPAEEILEDITNYQLLTTDNEIDDNDQDLSNLLLWEDEKISSKDVEFFDLIGSRKIEHLFSDVVETNRDDNFNLSLWEEENELATSPYLEITSSGSRTDSAIASSLTEASLLNELALEEILAATPRENVNQVVIENEDFLELEALLDENEDDAPQISSKPLVIGESAVVESENPFSVWKPEDDFSQWEDLLTQSDLPSRSKNQTLSDTTATSRKTSTNKIPGDKIRATIGELETIKVPVRQLNDISNVVGELVVNRNTLEQDRERLRQYVDTLLAQVQHLSTAGMKMQEYYEGSLLKASLLSSRRLREYKMDSNASYRFGENVDSPTTPPYHGFSEIEMDQFTPFHVLAQEMIEFIVRVRESASDIEFVGEKIEQVTRQLGQATSKLQEKLTKSRMVPFSQVIDRLRRGVRDNAIKYGKQVELVTEGVHTLIDKMILDHLTYPLTHILNNAIAHGIETPQVRQATGKSPTGIISIRAVQQVNQTIISVSDDGIGIDHQEVKNKAIKKGIITFKQAQSMSRFDIYKLLFLPCFSTADEVNDIKGRGVGLNVVENDINHIRGRVTTDSTPGIGTTFTIFLPQTLSICRAVLCACDQFKIAFPMDGVEDTLSISANSQIIQQDLHEESFMIWRGVKLPIKPLKDILVFNRQLTSGKALVTKKNNDMISVLVVRSGNTMLGLQIDQVLGEQEIVIKQLEGPVSKPIGIAGATVLGDGMIMPIADVAEIIDISDDKMSKFWQNPTSPPADISNSDHNETTVLIVDDSITVRELLSLTFHKAGYRVEQARDGQEAWDKLRSGLLCNLVLCDIEMPRCDGLELLSRIHQDDTLNHLPVAMLTSRGADKHRKMAVELGASGYFTKPYLEEALLEAAARMLKGEKLVTA
ncbi:hybrid sensor histidine kinase/response regulator [Dolichospermum circinale CS-534/05]|uniref:hybrid sensor histidine kinase/response regulator n=1 Tax=Dolichospermum circinale TaxID=109265 RepID=UPI00232FB402|nr:hybrid sensor histidine kinase/response regulator [Dolichospermum circinale]MDB9492281.1 hybrid sensor histidine kinase/response regulator [Dolichospermum circinale CS-534/05]